MPQWWRFKAFVDWRLRLKGDDEDDTDFDAEGWADG